MIWETEVKIARFFKTPKNDHFKIKVMLLQKTNRERPKYYACKLLGSVNL